MVKKTIWAALALLCAAAMPAQASEPSVVKLADVANEVLGYTRYTVFDDVMIGIDGGVVTLAGKVTMPYKAEDLARRVSRVAGVEQVRNHLTVLPVSQFDDSLRSWLAHAIYDHPLFLHYASMANPPIHIVVDGGRVTLTGVVNSEVERTVAYGIARSSLALSVTNELKTDAEMPRLLDRGR